MIQELLETQQKALAHFFQTVSREEIERALQTIAECRGTLVLSGVGKSGLIAQKIAATFVSTGTSARYLCSSSALHGDIGSVLPEDLFLAFSKSGYSQELLELIPHIQKRGVKTIAIVSSSQSKLASLCSQVIHLPVLQELCPFDLAPTISTEIQLMLGDILAIALMRKKNFSLSDFAANHPAGLLGRKISWKVSDLMFKGDAIPLCKPTDRLIDRLHELSMKRCGCLVVADEKTHLLGIFTDGDLRRSVQTWGGRALETTLGDLMTKSPKTISSDHMAIDAVRIMEEDPAKLITVLPVLSGERVVGLIRMHDILQAGLY